MRVLFVGKKRHAGANRNVCTRDVMLLEDIEDDQTIAIVRVDTHKFCYDLESLARWFLQDPSTRDTLPTLPETRTPVPALVYRRIVREAHMRVPGFREFFATKSAGLTPDRRTFLLTGTRPTRRRAVRPVASNEDALSLDDITRMLLGDEEESLASLSDEQLFDMLPGTDALNDEDMDGFGLYIGDL